MRLAIRSPQAKAIETETLRLDSSGRDSSLGRSSHRERESSRWPPRSPINFSSAFWAAAVDPDPTVVATTGLSFSTTCLFIKLLTAQSSRQL